MTVKYSESRIYVDMAQVLVQSEQFKAIQAQIKADGFTAGTNIGPFLARQLESIDSRIQAVIERELPFLKLMSANVSEVMPGSTSYTWEQEDHVGNWRKIGSHGKDLPTTDVSIEDFTYSNDHYGASYEVTTKEMRAAIMAGRPLETRKADAVRRKYNEIRNSLAMFGDAAKGKTGFVNDANVTPTVVATGAAASTEWANKTGEEMYEDIAAIVNTVKNASLNTINPNVVALPIAQYNLAFSTKFNSDGNVGATVMQVAEMGLGVEFIAVPELADSVTVSGTDYDQIIAYERDPLFIEFMQGMDITMRPGQWNGLTWTVPFEAELVGTVIRKPVAFAAGYGI